MSDYIKREDAMKPLYERWKAAESRSDDDIAEIVKMDYITVSNVPSADVEPVRHATCKEYEDSYSARCVCSECDCNFEYPRKGKVNYCPNCGARMDGGEQENE